jgi:hypothetical protein
MARAATRLGRLRARVTASLELSLRTGIGRFQLLFQLVAAGITLLAIWSKSPSRTRMLVSALAQLPCGVLIVLYGAWMLTFEPTRGRPNGYRKGDAVISFGLIVVAFSPVLLLMSAV